MSYLKTLNSTDVVITPFEVNKGFSFIGKSIASLVPYGEAVYGTGSYGQQIVLGNTINTNYIDRFLAVNTYSSNNSDFFNLDTEPTTGYFATYYQKLVFNSVKQLYYSNFITSPTGDSLATASLVPGVTPDGDKLIGPVTSRGRFDNTLQSNLTPNREFPSIEGATLGILSVPSKLYGDYIQPSTFNINFGSGSGGDTIYNIVDDGEGNLLLDNQHCGNIIYKQGIAILTGRSIFGYGADEYGIEDYGNDTGSFSNDPSWVEDFATTLNISCSFSSSFNIYETQYKCTIRANEYNYSLNPSLLKNYGNNKILISGSNEYKDFATGSDFSPYVTTIGLYNENQELLAVGKLAQPLPTSQTTDTTILINIDR